VYSHRKAESPTDYRRAQAGIFSLSRRKTIITELTTVPFLDLGASYRDLKSEIDEAVGRALASGWYILGPEVSAFEDAFAASCGAAHVVGVANGLDALHLVLRAWRVGPGDEVIVASNAYIATWLAITMTGATVVPVEPREATGNLDPDRLEAAITPRTRVVLALHLYGQPAEMTAIMSIARRHGLRVLEDAAQAHGAAYEGRPAGVLGDAAAWSFYPTKNLGAFGDAGAVMTGDAETADQVRVLRNYGSRRRYDNEVAGFNSRLDPMQAAILGVKLRRLDEWNRRRRRLADRYHAALAGCPDLKLPVVAAGADPAWHLYVVRTPHRDALQAHLAQAGVETLIHYPIPPHKSGAYRSSPLGLASFPIAERLAGQVLSLPVGPHMSDADQDRVIAAVQAFSPAMNVS
jgi:dTDP-4-amino-4,6-dideoxygalactose transaminase